VPFEAEAINGAIRASARHGRGRDAQTIVARAHPVKPFDDKRVRQAMRYAIDSNAVPSWPTRGSARSASTTT
jgi:hypothetical protein